MKFKIKIFIGIILISILIPFALFQIYITMSINTTESQVYEVIRKEKLFEIRYYPAATMAMIYSKATSYKDLGYSGFSKLA